MKRRRRLNPVQRLGKAIGVGLISGLAGTVAISLSQMIEMKLTKREPSTVPEEAVSKTLDIQAVSDDKKEKVSQEVHWVYGTSWGISRGLLSLACHAGPFLRRLGRLDDHAAAIGTDTTRATAGC